MDEFKTPFSGRYLVCAYLSYESSVGIPVRDCVKMYHMGEEL